MKKTIALLLAVLVTVTMFAACVKPAESVNPEAVSETVTDAPQEQPSPAAAEEQPTEEPAPTPTPEPEKPAPKLQIALIQDGPYLFDGLNNQHAWEGITAFAAEKGLTEGVDYKNYEADFFSDTQSCTTHIEQAISDGANVIVCAGYTFEESVYLEQTAHPDVMFLLMEATPHDETTENGGCAENTCSVYFRVDQASFLAGYAAVMDGSRNFGVLNSIPVPEVARYACGFLHGVNLAAEELGVTNEVSVRFRYCNWESDDSVAARLTKWYSDGVETVFVCGAQLIDTACQTASACNGTVICADYDYGDLYPCVLTGTVKNLDKAVAFALEDLYANDGKWSSKNAGSSIMVGAEENAVGLLTDNWNFRTFTVADCEALYERLRGGQLYTLQEDLNDLTGYSVSIAEELE